MTNSQRSFTQVSAVESLETVTQEGAQDISERRIDLNKIMDEFSTGRAWNIRAGENYKISLFAAYEWASFSAW